VEAESRQPRTPSEASLPRQALANSAPAILIALVLLLPFLGKAHTIDDVTFLLQAQHLLTDPLHPTAFDMVFHGERIRLSRDLVTGPVMAYLLLPAVMLGGAEWVAHAVQAVLLAGGAFFTAALSLRLGQDGAQATLAGILVVASPAVLAMTATAMPDVPAMVFAVAGMERLVAGKQSRSSATASVGALLLGVAALARPHALLLFPCAALLLTDVGTLRSGIRGLVRQWLTPPILTLVVGVAAWGALVVLTRDPLSGATIARTSIRRTEVGNVAFNLASFFLHWSVAFPLAVLWPVLRGRAVINPRRTIVVFAAGFLLATVGMYMRFGLGYGLPAVLLACYGLDVLADIVLLAWRTRSERQLALILWLLIGAATAGYVHLPAKVLIPSAPAMALLLSSHLGGATGSRRAMTLVGATVAMGLFIGVLVMKADAALAAVGREGGRIVAFYRARGERVWFDGGWGYQWYALRAGGMALADTEPLPQPGDVVVAGLAAKLVHRSYPEKVLLERRVFDAPGGRLFYEGAGFYENLSGPLPWVWGTGEIGRIEAWRIGTQPRAR
jgi:hypothetical protein